MSRYFEIILIGSAFVGLVTSKKSRQTQSIVVPGIIGDNLPITDTHQQGLVKILIQSHGNIIK